LIAELDANASTPHEEQFIRIVVLVPWEDPGKLHQFELLAIQLRNNFRSPMLVNDSELLCQRDLIHMLAPCFSTSTPTEPIWSNSR
jgi:hypothetical protein